jgi:hypothetical protein
MEIALSPPPATLEEKFDLLLSLDELTAQLDALTDGFFSERLEKIYQNHSELDLLFSSPVDSSQEDSQSLHHE